MTVGPVGPREAWLLLGADGIAARLPGFAPDIDVRRVTGDDLQAELLRRPRAVIVARPPAQPEDVEAVVAERRLQQSLRTVLLTDPGDLALRLSALERGFDDALPTTIDAAELAARVRRLTHPPRRPSRSSIRINDRLELDLQAYELLADGRPQRLRPKELQLLAVLASHPRRAFTRRELIDRIWGPQFAGDARTIDVHLRWLRSKIEADPERPVHLVTIRGRGYRFDPA